MQITADISKILKNVQRDLTFIFDVLSESRIGFVSFFIFLTLELLSVSQELVFYRKQNKVQNRTMRNYVETFHANIGHSLA